MAGEQSRKPEARSFFGCARSEVDVRGRRERQGQPAECSA